MSLCIPPNLRTAGAGHTELCIKVLAGIASQKAVPGRTRVGRSHLAVSLPGPRPTAYAGKDGNDFRTTFRHLSLFDSTVPIAAIVHRAHGAADLDGILVSLREAIAAADYPYPIDQDLDELVWPRVERLI